MTLTDSTARATDAAPSLSDRARKAWTATLEEREVKLAERRGQQRDNALAAAVADVGNWLGEDALSELVAYVAYVSEERREVRFDHNDDGTWSLLHTRVVGAFDVERRLELVVACPDGKSLDCRGDVLVGVYIKSLADLGAALEVEPMPCSGCAPCLHTRDEPTEAEPEPAPDVDPRQAAIDAFLDAFENLREMSTAGQAVDFRDLDVEPF